MSRAAGRLRAALTPAVLVAWGLTLTLLGAVALASELLGRDVAFFTREPAIAVLRESCADESCSYAGLVANVGTLAWAAGAAVALFAAAALGVPSAVRRLLLAGGALSVVLLLDDTFLLHENVFRQLVPRGESVAFAAYLVFFVAFGLAFRDRLRASARGPLAAIALALFALSVLVDRADAGAHLVEDGAKLLAIVTWTAFLTGTAADAARPDASVRGRA